MQVHICDYGEINTSDNNNNSVNGVSSAIECNDDINLYLINGILCRKRVHSRTTELNDWTELSWMKNFYAVFHVTFDQHITYSYRLEY